MPWPPLEPEEVPPVAVGALTGAAAVEAAMMTGQVRDRWWFQWSMYLIRL